MGASTVAKKKQERVELRAEADWVRRVEAEAERWGLTVSSYIRLAVNEKMERDRRGADEPGEGEPCGE